MTRRTLSTAADLAAGTLLLLLALASLVGSEPAGLGEAIAFLIKVTMPVAGLLLVVRGASGPPSIVTDR